jgi:ketosteroid isomerase-like protein
MNPNNWSNVQSIVIDGKLALTKLVRAGRESAIFEIDDAEGGDQPRYYVQLVRTADASEAQQIVSRLEEARYLDHPGILRSVGVGIIDADNLVFSVTPKPLAVLAEVPGKMPVDEAQLLTANLASVLSFLHAENLVFCNLRPEAVWKTENGWVLADFSQLRLIGRADTHELRRALVRFGDVPPEAYQGMVSPAWDVWSLGILLQRVFTGDPGNEPRARQLRAGLPEPFQQIVRECLDPNPNARPTLARVETILDGAVPPEQPPSEPVVATAAPTFEYTPRHLRAMDETNPGRSLRSFFRTPRLSWLIIFIVGILGVVIWTFALTRKNEERPVAATQIAAAPPEADRVKPATEPAPADPSIRESLDRWIATMRTKDMAGQVRLYAPMVETFYGQHHVARSRIAAIKKREFGTMGVVNRFDATNVQITQIAPDNAVVLFTKNWAFGNDSQRTGAVRSQLTLKKIDGEWKVVAERELKS